MNKVEYNSTTQETTIYLDQGTSFEHTFTFTFNDLPVNLTGFDARLQVRKSYGATSAWYNGTLANLKLEMVDASAGILKVMFAPTDTSAVRFAAVDDSTLDNVFDLELIEIATTKVYRPVKGTLVLQREVTR